MCLGVIIFMDMIFKKDGLSKEEYNMLADAILYEVNPQAYLFFVLEEMSREHSKITTADTASLLKSTYNIYNKEEPKYGRKVRFNRREIQEISYRGR